MRNYLTLFLGFPAIILGSFISLQAQDSTAAISGLSFMLCGTIALVKNPDPDKEK